MSSSSSRTWEEGGSGDTVPDIQVDPTPPQLLPGKGPAGESQEGHPSKEKCQCIIKFFGSWSVEMEDVDKLRMQNQLIYNSFAPRLPKDNERKYLSSPLFSSPAIGGIPAADWSCHVGTFKGDNGVDYISMCIILRGFPGLPADSCASLDVAYQIDLMRPRSDEVLFSRRKCVERFSPTIADMCSGWRKFLKFGSEESFNATLPFKVTLTVSEPKVILPKPIPMEVRTRQDDDGFGVNVRSSEPEETTEYKEEDSRGAVEKVAVTMKLWETMEGADVAVLSQNSTIKAHRSVLIGCSEVLAGKLKPCDDLEGGGRIVYTLDLQDIEDCWVEDLLEYCYTKTTKAFNQFASCVKLCRIADRFKMKSLEKDAFLQLMEFAGDPIKPWALVFLLRNIVEFVLDEQDCMELLRKKIMENFVNILQDKHFEHWFTEGGIEFLHALFVPD